MRDTGTMSTGYRLAYRFGFTPWEQAGVGFGPQLASLLDREEVGLASPYGKALDVGCGTGAHAIELARRGWQVTGVDAVAKALTAAREKVAATDAEVRFVEGDATRLEASVGDGYRFLLDVGCFHGFKPSQRDDYARGASAVTDPGGTLLMFAFGPGRRGPLPRGASREEIVAAFKGWELNHDEAAETAGMPGPLKNSEPRWYRLTRMAPAG
jgi:SAM-dependent methyltransferase